MLKRLLVVNLIVFKNQIYKTKPSCKILKFIKPLDGFLSDEDVNVLIMGVVNLIKNNAIKKTEFNLNRQIKYYKDLLNLNLNKVVKLEREIKKLKGKQIVNCK